MSMMKDSGGQKNSILHSSREGVVVMVDWWWLPKNTPSSCTQVREGWWCGGSGVAVSFYAWPALTAN